MSVSVNWKMNTVGLKLIDRMSSSKEALLDAALEYSTDAFKEMTTVGNV